MPLGRTAKFEGAVLIASDGGVERDSVLVVWDQSDDRPIDFLAATIGDRSLDTHRYLLRPRK